MSQMYSVSFEGITQSTAGEILALKSGQTGWIRIHSVAYTQDTDPGDIAAEMARVVLTSIVLGFEGTGGVNIDGVPLDPSGTTDTARWARHNTTAGSTGADRITETFQWQNGWFYRPSVFERIVVFPNALFAVILDKVPTNPLDTSLTLIYEMEE